MIVTIDGPAGAGKSSVARQLAERLGFRFLDTGAMYRAIAWAALETGTDLLDSEALGALAMRLPLQFDDARVWVDGRDVSHEVRTPRVTAAVRYVADSVPVRERLSQLQRAIAGHGDTVSEGRDQGTEVFPRAECKIFLTASPEERAKRRWCELQARGESITIDEVLAQQNDRDTQDRSRQVGTLMKADDAVEICTDGLTMEQVLDRLEQVVLQRRAELRSGR